MRRFHSRPVGDVVAVITAAELADWIGVAATDPLLGPMAIAATAATIDYLEFELIDRGRVTTYENWPTLGTNTSPSLSPNDSTLSWEVALPYAQPDTVGITEVLVAGEATTDYRLIECRTATLYFDGVPVGLTNDQAALKLTYTAGYGPDASDVPQIIRTAVTMAADFLYNNRGSCSAADALDKSGASTLLYPYKANAVIL